jgi:anaerobic selenocysteine-containing dehydrogenase
MIRRRDLLGGAALLAAGCRKKALAPIAVTTVKGWRAGEERWPLSTCGMCDAGCGIRVRVVEGRAVKIEGNPDHPVNRGGLCARGQAAVQALSVERVQTPLRRVNGRLQPISWDQAMGELTDRLTKLRASRHPERLLLIDGQFRGFTHELWARFMEAFGSPNHVGCESNTFGGAALALRHMQGVYELPAYDLARARLVLVMGAELLESSVQTMHFLRAASAVDERRQRRLRVVCASPRRPAGGCRVDEWVSLQPGSAGALALGIAHVLLRDGLADVDFLRQSQGFERWRDNNGVEQAGFREQVEAFPPRKAAEYTGVSVEEIERLAHALASTKPALVGTAGDVARASNGLATALAIHGLNAVLGNIGRAGGVFVPPRAPLSPWPAVVPDPVALTGRRQPRMDGVGTTACPFGASRVPSLASRDQAEIVFLHQSDAASVVPGRSDGSSAGPFTVSFASVLHHGPDPAADLVLPAPLPLESWDLVHPAPAGLTPSLSFRQPVVAPPEQTRHTGNVILNLAASLGGSVAKAFPWASYKEAVIERLRGLCSESNDPESLLADMEENCGWWPEEAEV